MSQFFTSDGQTTGVAASVLPMNIQDRFPLGLTGLLFAVQGTLKSLLQHHSSKASVRWCSAFFKVQLSHTYMTTGKTTDITLPTKVHLVKAMVFPVVTYGCESWTVKKAECQRIDAFELWFWRRLLRAPWTPSSPS